MVHTVIWGNILTQCAPDEQLKLVKDGKLQPRTCYAFSISEVLYIGSHHNSFLSEITGEFYCAAENREADAINAFETFGENEEISSGIIENAVTNMYTTTFDIGVDSGPL